MELLAIGLVGSCTLTGHEDHLVILVFSVPWEQRRAQRRQKCDVLDRSALFSAWDFLTGQLLWQKTEFLGRLLAPVLYIYYQKCYRNVFCWRVHYGNTKVHFLYWKSVWVCNFILATYTLFLHFYCIDKFSVFLFLHEPDITVLYFWGYSSNFYFLVIVSTLVLRPSFSHFET